MTDEQITAINTVLAQEANRINDDIYRRTVHTSPWIDLTKQTTFRDGQGYQQTILESPKISLEDLRCAVYRQEQIRAIMDLMTEAVRYTWETRYRDEFDRVVDNLVLAIDAGSVFSTGNEGDETTAITVTAAPDARLSNALLDKIYNQLVEDKGAASEAYGRENGRPIFALVCSSGASRDLLIEDEVRDDVRYNNAKVSDLIAPLGVEKSFRGFYHLIDDLAPRFDYDADNDKLVRVLPYKVTGGITTIDDDYESAEYEAAYLIHPHVCESQIPNPLSGAGAIKFNPVNYRGQFKWMNIPDDDINPDGTIGFFRGVLASATKPIKTDLGYTILYSRTAVASAGV
jgi:hypothetical protein